MEPRIEVVKGGVVAIGDGWAVIGESEDQARARFAEARDRHIAIAARPDPHPVPTEPRRPAWQSPTGAPG
jgi:hypothetical protein